MNNLLIKFKNKLEGRKNILYQLLILLSFLLFMYGYRSNNFNCSIVSFYVLFFSLLINLKSNRILLYIFYCSFFVFIVNRPFIDIIDSRNWQEMWEMTNIKTGLTIIYSSIISLAIGARIHPTIKVNKNGTQKIKFYIKKIEDFFDIEFKYFIVLGIIFFLFITYIIYIYTQIDIYIFMKGRMYEEYYLYYKPSYGKWANIFSKLYIYFFYMILSFKITKKMAFIVLLMNVLSTIPMLLVGQRGGFIIALLFSFIYYLIRSLSGSSQKWFSRFEYTLILISIPVLVTMMNLINEGRHGGNLEFYGLLNSIKTFLHKQSITFDTVMYGVTYKSMIDEAGAQKNYLFGQVVEMFKFNPISLKIFGNKALPSGNNSIRALKGYSYAHILSYFSHHSYLKGFGFGTSYILEAFQTYGFLGVVFVNILMGILLVEINKRYNYSFVTNYLSLIVLYSVFYLPRQSFTTIFFFLFRPYFWIANIIVFLLIKISIQIQKSLSNQSINKYMNNILLFVEKNIMEESYE